MILQLLLKRVVKLNFDPSFQRTDLFWRQNPALLYGLAFLVGSSAACGFAVALIFAALLLYPLFWAKWLPRDLRGRLHIACLWMLSAIFYCFFSTPQTELPANGLKGTGTFVIASIYKKTTHFGKFWIYQGSLRDFKTNEEILKGTLPCTLMIKDSKEIDLPPADCSYQLKGTLKQISKGHYSLTPEMYEPWLPVNGSLSLAQLRYDLKKKVSDYIIKHFNCRKSADFLIGITTGNFDNRLMCYEFSRFGLLHILAISGFHFSILILILGGIGHLLFPLKTWSLVLFILSTLYFLFIGISPSIFRAWITVGIALIGRFFEKEGSGLNSLGAALLVLLIYHPLVFLEIGFQFSFAVTGSILLFYPAIDQFLSGFFLRRRLSKAIEMNFFDQHCYLFLTYLRKAIALVFSVNLSALPLSLYHFHKFPLLSLLHNLFFPFLTTLSIFILFAGIVFPFLHSLNNLYTQFTLNFIYGMPRSFDFIFRISTIPDWIMACYLSLLLFFGIYFHSKIKENRESILFRYF